MLSSRRYRILPVMLFMLVAAVFCFAPSSAFAASSGSEAASGQADLSAGHATLTAQSSTKTVEDYTYSVRPLISPFNGYLYVKTDNPDPTSFRLVDKSSKYIGKDADSDAGVFSVVEKNYLDVKYEKKKTYRVKGGYIFYDRHWDSDGGALVLQKRTQKATSTQAVQYADTKKKVKCAALQDNVDYLISTFTSSSKGFFDNLDAVQSALYEYALYPAAVYDVNKKNTSHPYPLLAASPYPELTLNDHYSMFESADAGSLMLDAYPFILDSYSFPNTMYAVAKQLNPKCTGVGSSYAHWLVEITLDGTTRSYGDAGKGGSDPVYSHRIGATLLFDSSSADYALKGSLATWESKLLEYKAQATQDAAQYRDLLQGNTFKEKIGKGTWIRVAYEGMLGYHMGYFAYYATNYDGSGARLVSNVWVDGRYINEHEVFSRGATFADHPTASIIVRNKVYTDYSGVKHQGDIVYDYDATTDTWRAFWYYNGRNYTSLDSDIELPDDFVLTRSEVEKMGVDRNTLRPAESGLVYDGTAYPGTPFKTTLMQGVSLPSSVTVYTENSVTVKPTYTPANATYPISAWKSSNESIATVDSPGETGVIRGVSPGTATITLTTNDGGYTAQCTVRVKKSTSIASAKATLPKDTYTYTGKAVKVSPTVKLGKKKLVLGTDYTIEYRDSNQYYIDAKDVKKVGNYSIVVRGMGKYSGSVTVWFAISKTQVKFRTCNSGSYGYSASWGSWMGNGDASHAYSSWGDPFISGLQMKLANKTAKGSIKYRVYTKESGWGKWISEGKTAGAAKGSRHVQAIQVKLTGKLKSKYDVYYRMRVQNATWTKGWLGWAKNGAKSGYIGSPKSLVGVAVKVVPKGEKAPGSTKKPFKKR